MGPSWTSLTSDRNEKTGVSLCHRKVVINYRERRNDVVYEILTTTPGSPLCQFHAHEKLCHRDRRYGNIIVVVDNVVETVVRPFRVNEKGRVK